MPTILVVDDEPDILEVLHLTFEHAGYEVLTARDGAEALEVVERRRPDAMLLDVGMPHVDGWQVLERIKSGRTDLSDVPVVMVTAWTSEEDRLRGGIEGAVRYIGKPFDPNEVVRVVRELLAPDGTPEPVLRRQVQQSSLERLARMERGSTTAPEPEVPRVHLTRLDRPRVKEPLPDRAPKLTAGDLDALSPKQREVVRLVAEGTRVSDIARTLGVSRSNVYAIIRRAARRVEARDGRQLINQLRRLEMPPPGTDG